MGDTKKISTHSYYSHHLNPISGNVYQDKTTKHSDGRECIKERAIGNIGPINYIRPHSTYNPFGSLLGSGLNLRPSSSYGNNYQCNGLGMYGGLFGNNGLYGNNGYQSLLQQQPIISPIIPTYSKPATSVTIETKKNDTEKKIKKQKKKIEKQEKEIDSQNKRLEKIEQQNEYLAFMLAQKTKRPHPQYREQE
jgi:hypothetical protein